MFIKIKSNLTISDRFSQEMEDFVAVHNGRIIEAEEVKHESDSSTYKAVGLEYWHFTESMIENTFNSNVTKDISPTIITPIAKNLYECKREIGNTEYELTISSGMLQSIIETDNQDFIFISESKKD